MSVNYLMIVLMYFVLLYFVWANQRVRPFYNYYIVEKSVVMELWLGSYRMLE